MTRDGYTREEAETVYWLTYEAHAPAVDSPDDIETILGSPLNQWTMEEIDNRAEADAIDKRRMR